jgi:microcystin-dependent protein
MFAGNFAPAGWMFCEGQQLPISDYETLFNLIGTTYGGDGQSTFALPDLRGRLPIHAGSGLTFAQSGGSETVTLAVSQIPAHSHPLIGVTNNGTSPNPGGNMLAQPAATIQPYTVEQTTLNMNPGAIGPYGGSQAHENCPPYLCVDFIISLFGIFPSQT